MLPNMIRVQSKLSQIQGADDLLMQTANAAEEQKYTWNVCCVLQQSAVCIIILNNKTLNNNEDKLFNLILSIIVYINCY